MKRFSRPWFVLMGVSLLGCVSTTPDVTGTGQQLAVRQIQTREYDTLDKAMTLRAVVSTLQDLGFIIDTADADIATVTARVCINMQSMRLIPCA